MVVVDAVVSVVNVVVLTVNSVSVLNVDTVEVLIETEGEDAVMVTVVGSRLVDEAAAGGANASGF